MEFKGIKYELRQDDDSHWYWIPIELLEKFDSDLQVIYGKDYMEVADEVDTFIEDFDRYRTCGDPNNIPFHFELIKEKENGTK